MSMPFYVSPEQLMKDRADFARKGISRGRSMVAVHYADGILLASENVSQALHKISEIYDRIAFAAVGRYNEFENLRIAGVRLADMRGYAYDRRDVTARGLANAYAQTLGTIFSSGGEKPYEVEIFVAEIGDAADDDQIYRLTYDGQVADEHGFAVIGGAADVVVDLPVRALRGRVLAHRGAHPGGGRPGPAEQRARGGRGPGDPGEEPRGRRARPHPRPAPEVQPDRPEPAGVAAGDACGPTAGAGAPRGGAPAGHRRRATPTRTTRRTRRTRRAGMRRRSRTPPGTTCRRSRRHRPPTEASRPDRCGGRMRRRAPVGPVGLGCGPADLRYRERVRRHVHVQGPAPAQPGRGGSVPVPQGRQLGSKQQRVPAQRCPALPRRRQPPGVRHAGV